MSTNLTGLAVRLANAAVAQDLNPTGSPADPLPEEEIVSGGTGSGSGTGGGTGGGTDEYIPAGPRSLVSLPNLVQGVATPIGVKFAANVQDAKDAIALGEKVKGIAGKTATKILGSEKLVAAAKETKDAVKAIKSASDQVQAAEEAVTKAKTLVDTAQKVGDITKLATKVQLAEKAAKAAKAAQSLQTAGKTAEVAKEVGQVVKYTNKAATIAKTTSWAGRILKGFTNFCGRWLPGISLALTAGDIAYDTYDACTAEKGKKAGAFARLFVNVACTAIGAIIGFCIGGLAGALVGAGLGNMAGNALKACIPESVNPRAILGKA